MKLEEIKRKIFAIIEPSDNKKLAGKIFEYSIVALIIMSVIGVITATFEPSTLVRRTILCLQIIIVAVFTVEYLLRLWTADLLYPKESKLNARLRYIRSPMAIIDFAAILPFYLPFLFHFDLLSLRVLRLGRLFWLFKLNRYSAALTAVWSVFTRKFREVLVSLIAVGVLLIIASMMIYHAEHAAQPDKFRNAFSGLWWAVTTLTTVGYGDIYPVTVPGKIIGSIIALLGIGVVALPAGILSAGFMEYFSKTKKDDDSPKYCPHCGKKLK